MKHQAFAVINIKVKIILIIAFSLLASHLGMHLDLLRDVPDRLGRPPLHAEQKEDDSHEDDDGQKGRCKGCVEPPGLHEREPVLLVHVGLGGEHLGEDAAVVPAKLCGKASAVIS